MTRLTWLLGPPGAGKTTFARRQHEHARHVELDAMLGPLVDPLRLRKGVLSARGHLVAAIRAIELHPEHATHPPLLVVAGLVPETSLFPLRPGERVWLLMPERSRWNRQLRERPCGSVQSPQYDDYEYSEIWYDRFSEWLSRGLPIQHIEHPFEPALLGKLAEP